MLSFIIRGCIMYQLVAKIKPESLALFCIATAIIVICSAIQYFQLNSLMQLQIAATLEGQYWRIFTAHLSHLNIKHLVMNMLGMCLCLIIFGRDLHYKHWLINFCIAALVSSSALLLIYPADYTYVGFSDILHSWIVLGAFAMACKERWLGISIICVMLAKVVLEQFDVFVMKQSGVSAANISTESHLFGTLAGMLYGLIFVFLKK